MKNIIALIIALFISVLTAPVAKGQISQNHTASPQKGEGMSAFLLRNGYNVAQYKDQFIELNKSRLGKDNALLLGVKYVFPDKNNSILEPLLGLKYQEVKQMSNTLAGATYYLVSGHGGPDPGAIGEYQGHTICEDEYAYDIMLRLSQELLSRGAKVHIIIQDKNDGIRDEVFLKASNTETCMGCEIPLNQTERLQQRSDAINRLYTQEKNGYCRAVFIHIDSRSKKKQIDVFFYHHVNSPKGERLAQTMRECFERKYNQFQPNRGFSGTVSHRNLQVLNNTYPVAVFLELGNIQNSHDQQRFLLPDNRQALAKWMADGLEDDYKKEK